MKPAISSSFTSAGKSVAQMFIFGIMSSVTTFTTNSPVRRIFHAVSFGTKPTWRPVRNSQSNDRRIGAKVVVGAERSSIQPSVLVHACHQSDGAGRNQPNQQIMRSCVPWAFPYQKSLAVPLLFSSLSYQPLAHTRHLALHHLQNRSLAPWATLCSLGQPHQSDRPRESS